MPAHRNPTRDPNPTRQRGRRIFQRSARAGSARAGSPGPRAQRRSRTGARRGVTLVELMLVITVVVIMMTLAVTSIRPALENRKTREAARIFTAVVARAKARAAELDRPVGIWIERGPGAPIVDGSLTDLPSYNFSNQVYIAEVPLPYSGDAPESNAQLFDLNGDGRADAARFDAASNSRFSGDGVLVPLVQVGDFVRFNYRGPAYIISSIWTQRDMSSNPIFFWIIFGWSKGPDDAWGNVGDDDGSNGPDDGAEIGWPGSDDVWTAPPAPNPVGGRLPFQIFRQPSKVGPAVELPEGVVIDLSNSGAGLAGIDFRTPWVDSNGNGERDLGEPGSQPVVVMFSPAGQVTSVSYTTLGVLQTVTPMTSLNFLLGRLDQFDQGQNSPMPAVAAAPVVAFNRNLTDLRSLWVSISPRTGRVTTAENSFRPRQTLALPGPPFYFNVSMGGARELVVTTRGQGGR